MNNSETISPFSFCTLIFSLITLERARPVIFETFFLELIPVRMIPVIHPTRRTKPENYWKTIIISRQGLSCNKISNFSEKHFSGSAIILVPTVFLRNYLERLKTIGGGPPAEPCHEVLLGIFTSFESLEFWAEVFAEVFIALNVPAKQARKLLQKLRPKLRQKLRPGLPPPKRKLRPKTCSAETLC